MLMRPSPLAVADEREYLRFGACCSGRDDPLGKGVALWGKCCRIFTLDELKALDLKDIEILKAFNRKRATH